MFSLWSTSWPVCVYLITKLDMPPSRWSWSVSLLNHPPHPSPNSQARDSCKHFITCMPNLSQMFRSVLNPLKTKKIFNKDLVQKGHTLKNSLKFTKMKFWEKNSHIPGRGELLHQYTKFEGNLIVLNFF